MERERHEKINLFEQNSKRMEHNIEIKDEEEEKEIRLDVKESKRKTNSNVSKKYQMSKVAFEEE